GAPGSAARPPRPSILSEAPSGPRRPGPRDAGKVPEADQAVAPACAPAQANAPAPAALEIVATDTLVNLT
ncbi:MAG: hypothetical protein AAF763_17570, partial [Pseudomonadota bacterium]